MDSGSLQANGGYMGCSNGDMDRISAHEHNRGLIAVVLGPGIAIIAYQRLEDRIAIFAFHCAVVVIMIYLHILASCELIAGVLGAGIAIVAVPWAMHACRPVIGIDGAFVAVITVY